MKRKIPSVCLLTALVLASIFLPALASAGSQETPRAAMRAGTDWLGSALAWLDSVLERIDRDRQRQDRNGSSSALTKTEEGEGGNSISGVCIDPMGRPRPCPTGGI